VCSCVQVCIRYMECGQNIFTGAMNISLAHTKPTSEATTDRV